MPRLLPRVEEGFLHDGDRVIRVGEPEWFEWLRNRSGFSVKTLDGRITFYKRMEGDREFWVCSKKLKSGRMIKRYAGKAGALVQSRLDELVRSILQCNLVEKKIPQDIEARAIAYDTSEIDQLKARVVELEEQNRKLRVAMRLLTKNGDR